MFQCYFDAFRLADQARDFLDHLKFHFFGNNLSIFAVLRLVQ